MRLLNWNGLLIFVGAVAVFLVARMRDRTGTDFAYQIVLVLVPVVFATKIAERLILLSLNCDTCGKCLFAPWKCFVFERRPKNLIGAKISCTRCGQVYPVQQW